MMLLRPLPIQSMLERIGDLLERRRFFMPYAPMNERDVLFILRKITGWDLRFGPWRYSFNVIRDVHRGLSLELLLSTKYVPTKLCVLDITMDTKGYTFLECMDMFQESFLDTNDSIERWNHVCTRAEPYLTSPIPVYEVLEQMCEEVDRLFWRRTFETKGLAGMEVVELYPILAPSIATSYFFAPWALEVQLYETEDWYLFQYYLRNIHFDAVSFVLHEVEVPKFTQMPKFEMQEVLEDALVACEDARNAWNHFVFERGNTNVQRSLSGSTAGILPARTH